MKNKQRTIITWIFRLLAAAIMLQTLFFKFTSAPESVYIFTELGMEPWGRIGIGVMELIASLLILIPYTTALGAILGLGLMSGALFFHLTQLGIAVQNDSGQLFVYALLVFISCLILVVICRMQIIHLFHRIRSKRHE
ncbi:DoxX family protein [Fulvivirgaceae bacterium PWU5]|uniref:DoxX family protein n=1 Tax=Dawidia cretensis TaxID=2782350 RepID=A0AAP2GQL8_9BACT|nr:DoxX family protein [Dawidia cretensis]MBT1709469.1 DoxX family protein [Dawidia cretensis]